MFPNNHEQRVQKGSLWSVRLPSGLLVLQNQAIAGLQSQNLLCQPCELMASPASICLSPMEKIKIIPVVIDCLQKPTGENKIIFLTKRKTGLSSDLNGHLHPLNQLKAKNPRGWLGNAGNHQAKHQSVVLCCSIVKVEFASFRKALVIFMLSCAPMNLFDSTDPSNPKTWPARHPS